MSKLKSITEFPSPSIIISIIFCFLLPPLQSVVPDIEQTALRYIATQLLPNECQTILNHKLERSPDNLPLNGIDCFRKLVGWTSDLRINRRDVNSILGDRLRKIGRDDLAEWLVGPISKRNPLAEETFEYESWKNGKMNHRVSSSAPTISRIFGSTGSGIEPMGRNFDNFEMRKLKGIHTLDGFKDRSLVMVDPDSNRIATPVADGVTVMTTVQNQDPEERGGGSSTVKGNVDKDMKDSKNATDIKSNDKNKGNIGEDKKKHNNSKLSNLLPNFSDDKNSPCLRVPLGTALLVLGTIMTLTCCCALLLRNRIAACFDRLRGKKIKGGASKRISADEEQGFMGPRTFGKPPVRSGRKGGGSIDVANVGIQNNNSPIAGVSGSREFDERSTGCCNCCTRKKRKNKRKRKK